MIGDIRIPDIENAKKRLLDSGFVFSTGTNEHGIPVTGYNVIRKETGDKVGLLYTIDPWSAFRPYKDGNDNVRSILLENAE